MKGIVGGSRVGASERGRLIGATDLLSGETVEQNVKLGPMVPHLLRGHRP